MQFILIKPEKVYKKMADAINVPINCLKTHHAYGRNSTIGFRKTRKNFIIRKTSGKAA